MFIIYLHGFRSTAIGGKTETLRKMFPQHQVVGINYCPHQPHLASKQLAELMKSQSDQKDALVIGTSLGGFWTQWMVREFGVKGISINPSLHPDQTLQVGTYSTFDESCGEIEVTYADKEAFKYYKQRSGDTPTSKPLGNSANLNSGRCKVWLAMDDEILNASLALNELSDEYDVFTFDSGGHRFAQFDTMKDAIEEVIRF